MDARRAAIVALLLAPACAGRTAGSRGGAVEPRDETAPVRPNVAAARELDQQGVVGFRDGRYGDAARYFRAAFHLGGPSSELWNLARAYEKLDDAEDADRAITEYLAQSDLSPQDRADAEHEARAIRTRTSVLTVTTTPPGAVVSLDGKSVPGTTPLSLEIAAGEHVVVVKHGAYDAETRTFDAHFGRAVIVPLDLRPAGK
ncbi:MAG TPA: PEGA domain-containing protein [Polyangiaceae bacterium]|jgi:hypothetical protein